jgi:hypothetical protein
VIDGVILYTPNDLIGLHKKVSGSVPDFESGYEAVIRAMEETGIGITEYVYAAEGDVLKLFVEIMGQGTRSLEEIAAQISGIAGEYLNRKVEVSILDEESLQLLADIQAREHNVAEYALEPLHLAMNEEQLNFLKANTVR